MISRSPEQELYDACFRALSSLGVTIYSHSPPDGVPMPYIRMESTQIVPRLTKTKLMADGYIGFSVWGSATDRGRVAKLCIDGMAALSRIRKTESFKTDMHTDNRSTYEVLPDQTTTDDLWQARASTEWAIEAL